MVRHELHHATHAGLSHRHGRTLLFRFVADDALCCEEHSCDGSGVLKSYTLNLGWVDDTFGTQVFEDILASIVTEVALAFAHLLYHYGTLTAGILAQSGGAVPQWHASRC